MKNIMYRYNLLVLLMILLLTSCESEVNGNDDNIQETPVEIAVQRISVAATPKSRGEGAIKDETIGSRLPNLPVSFLRLDETEPGYPADYSGTTVVKSATISRVDTNPADIYNTMSFTPTEYYLTGGKNTKLWGWHPATAIWDETECKLDFGELDGSTDVMVTDFITGNNRAPVSTITFRHLLTQIIIKAYADNDVTNEWGGIQSITIENKKQICRVKHETGTGNDPDINLELEAPTDDLELVKKNPADHSDILSGSAVYGEDNPLLLPIAKNDAMVCGYAIIAPNTASTDDLVLHIATEKAGMRTVSIQRSFLAGNAYTLTLSLKKTTIEVSVAVNKWNVVNKEIVI